MVINEQSLQRLILKELEKVGCKKETLNHISNGHEIYGDNGVLDSSSLVQFIAGLSEWVEEHTNGNIDLFSFMDTQFLYNFRDITSISNYLSGHISNASI
ncbi:hypothetical protein Xvie_03628 [Xenorhabdus vietnamensis]|uniref:Carrier domain-containing protein n=1 Tax=Xenorhabdus vietnamensis TaxID=351656 RepID=A0A1Y2SAI8_9GAMM|nr:hypothetical protein [Xenorhabdus vietnamensis]OTA14537.1 hypothetical protein Xvie_03628 [Xenorhabdus vietnamensis]